MGIISCTSLYIFPYFPDLRTYFPITIQAVSFKVNLRKDELFVISIHRPPVESLEGSLDSLAKLSGHFTDKYDKIW